MIQKHSILTLIGVGLIKIAIGIINDWGSINVYFLTYIHYRMPELQINGSTSSTLAIIALLPTLLAVFLNNKVNDLLGYKNTIIFCALCYFGSGVIALIYFNVYTMFIFCLLIPVLSFGLSIVAIFHCLYSHFVQDRNKATAFAVILFGGGAILWNYFCTHYINPQNQKQTVKDNDGKLLFFSEDVANRVPSACIIITLGGGAIFLLGSLLIYDASPLVSHEEQLNQQNNIQSKKDENRQQRAGSVSQQESNIEQEDDNKRQTEQKVNELTQEQQQKKALTSPPFIILISIAMFGSIYHVFIQMNMKIIYSQTIQDDYFISNGMTALIASGLTGAAIWGFLGDKFGPIKMILLYCLIDLAVKIFSSFAENKLTFMVSMILLGLTDKAVLTLFGPALIEIYGFRRASKLLTYKFMTLVGSILVASLMKLVFKGIEWHILLFILLIFSVTNIVLGVLLKKNTA